MYKVGDNSLFYVFIFELIVGIVILLFSYFVEAVA